MSYHEEFAEIVHEYRAQEVQEARDLGYTIGHAYRSFVESLRAADSAWCRAALEWRGLLEAATEVVGKEQVDAWLEDNSEITDTLGF